MTNWNRATSALTFIGVLQGAPANALELTAPETRVVVEWDFRNQPLSKWANGLLLSRESEGPRIRAFDRNGRPVLNVAVVLPGSPAITLRSIASGGPWIAASGYAAEEGRLVPFIAWLDLTGRTVRVIQTGTFAPIQICFAQDGRLWAFGREFDAQYREKASYNLLRQYDPATRTLIRTALPRSALSRVQPPHPAAMAFMASGTDRLVLATQHQDWVEVSLDGGVLRQDHLYFPLNRPKIAGLAVTEAGIPLLSVHAQPEDSAASRAYVFRVPAEGDTPIEVARDSLTRILGTDGAFVVGALRLPELVWVRLQ